MNEKGEYNHTERNEGECIYIPNRNRIPKRGGGVSVSNPERAAQSSDERRKTKDENMMPAAEPLGFQMLPPRMSGELVSDLQHVSTFWHKETFISASSTGLRSISTFKLENIL